MKRWLLFVYKSEEPQGGWNDFEGAYDHKIEAEDKAHNLSELNKCLCYQIYDSKTCQLVACVEREMTVSTVNKRPGVFWKGQQARK